MKKIRILTLDERLFKELSLLMPKDFTLSPDAPFIILDTDTVKDFDEQSGERILRISRTPKEKDMQALIRPFTYTAFENALKRAFADGEALAFSPTEKKLLDILESAGGKPVSREALMKEIWDCDNADSLLNLYIHYLREKLEKDGRRRIFAVRGKGYFYKC